MPKRSVQPTTQIVIPLERIGPDPIQYKPYNPQFVPQGMGVAVEVPNSEIIAATKVKGGMNYILSPRGVAIVCKQIATAIAEVYAEG